MRVTPLLHGGKLMVETTNVELDGDYVAIYGRASLIEGAAARGPTLELIRKYRAEPDVLPHWERINANNDRVIIAIDPERVLWRSH